MNASLTSAFSPENYIYSLSHKAGANEIKKRLSRLLISLDGKNLPAMRETWVQYLGGEDPLGKEMATHSSIFAWTIPWTEEPGGLHMRWQRVRHDLATKQQQSYINMICRLGARIQNPWGAQGFLAQVSLILGRILLSIAKFYTDSYSHHLLYFVNKSEM